MKIVDLTVRVVLWLLLLPLVLLHGFIRLVDAALTLAAQPEEGNRG